MSGAGNVIRPKGSGSGSRAAWLVVLTLALALGSGCAGHDSAMGYGNEFAQGVRPHSDDTARLLRNAHYLKMTGQSAMALKELEEAHRQNPGNMKVANVLGQYYDELKMNDRAQKVYQEALALEPDNPVLKNNLCYSYYLAGHWQQAETCYRQLLARHPQNQTARNNLGLLLCRQGRGEEAKRLWQETEGQAVAERKWGEVMAALGRTGETRYAGQIRPIKAGEAAVRQTKHPAKTAVVGSPSPKPSPPAHQTARKPSPPASDATVAGAPAKKVVIPRPGSEPSLPSRKVPAPMPLADRLAAARSVPAVSRPEPRPAVKPARSAIPPAVTPSPSPAAAPVPPPADPKVTAAKGTKVPASQAVPPSPPEPQKTAPAPSPTKKTQTTARAKPITAKELLETKIAVINGNGLVGLARDTRSLLGLEGFNVVAIANYRDFGVDHTVIHYRPDSKRVAALLHHKFFPGAVIEPNDRMANNIDVEVILGRDLVSQEHAAAAAAARRPPL